MKYILVFISIITFQLSYSQSRGVRIGYIDMNYILEKSADYAEAKNILDQKVQKWKLDIETKKNEIKTYKDNLNIEKTLLTKELIEEREEEIKLLESELLDYQEKRFGPKGDLIIQKSVLVKPIQDQVFTIIQDIAEKKNYDFIFDKSSDLTMLFAAQRHDISDQVLRAMNRAEKREQLSKKDLKEQEKKEANEDFVDENPGLAERQKILDEKKAAREKLLAERKAQRDSIVEARKRQAAEKREKLQSKNEDEKSGTVIENNSSKDEKSNNGEKSSESNSEKVLTPDEKRALLEEERKKKIEERKKALEERKRKILEEREAAKKAKEEEKE